MWPLAFLESGVLHEVHKQQTSATEDSCSTKYYIGASVYVNNHMVTILYPKFWILQNLLITVS